MQLTRYTDYSLRILLFLCSKAKGEASTATEIAEFYDISRNHVSKVISMLAEADIISTTRGRGGGIQLACAPKDLNIGELVRATENLNLVECFSPATSKCPLTGACTVESLLQNANAAFLSVLDQTTLADLLPASSQLVSLGKG